MKPPQRASLCLDPWGPAEPPAGAAKVCKRRDGVVEDGEDGRANPDRHGSPGDVMMLSQPYVDAPVQEHTILGLVGGFVCTGSESSTYGITMLFMKQTKRNHQVM